MNAWGVEVTEGKVALHESLNLKESASSEDVISLQMYWDKFDQKISIVKNIERMNTIAMV